MGRVHGDQVFGGRYMEAMCVVQVHGGQVCGAGAWGPGVWGCSVYTGPFGLGLAPLKHWCVCGVDAGGSGKDQFLARNQGVMWLHAMDSGGAGWGCASWDLLSSHTSRQRSAEQPRQERSV